MESENNAFPEYILNNFSNLNPMLSIGCGNGADEIYFAGSGLNVYATDINHENVSKLNSSAVSKKLFKLKTLELNILKRTDFPDNNFNSVYFKMVLHYFNYDQIAHIIIPELKRIMKPNGYLFIIYRLIEPDNIKNKIYKNINSNNQSLTMFDISRNELTYRSIIDKNNFYNLFSDKFKIEKYELQNENLYNKLSDDYYSLIAFSILRNIK